MQVDKQNAEEGSVDRHNQRYNRQYLKPVAKSVYQNNKVVRLNGSLNGTLGLSGLNMMESAKTLHSNNFQFGMSTTHNLNILNNSFNIGNKKMQTMEPNQMNDSMAIGGSPRNVRSLQVRHNHLNAKTKQQEAVNAFICDTKGKIPEIDNRDEREERMQNLLRKPEHKVRARQEANLSQSDKLMSAPLTMEAKDQFINLPLINTLRASTHNKLLDPRGLSKGGEDEEGKEENTKPMDTVPQPPSFANEYVDTWQKKFHKHIKDREFFKKQLGRTQEISCLTRNTNIKPAENDGLGKKSARQTSFDPGQTNKNFLNDQFNTVLKRRKSRQSTFAPGNIDFNFAGDTSQYQHLIAKRSDIGQPNQAQLNFEMNMRGYKNQTEYNAFKHWQYPAFKKFQPRAQWKQITDDHSLVNREYTKKKDNEKPFNDKFAEKNANELLHQFDKRGVNSSSQWQCSLRDLKRFPPKLSSKQSPSKKKED